MLLNLIIPPTIYSVNVFGRSSLVSIFDIKNPKGSHKVDSVLKWKLFENESFYIKKQKFKRNG